MVDCLEKFTDKNIDNIIDNSVRRKALQVNREHMEANYGNNVDFQLLQKQVWLCEETRKVLYSTSYTKSQISYNKITRPYLNNIVSNLSAGCSSPIQIVLAILRFCRDLYKKRNGMILFYGGTEEELIKKGEQLCECLARLMVALCEIAGIFGRIITHTIGGHLVCEILIGNGWIYVDPRKGLLFIKPDGNFASTWDLIQNPSIVYNQPDSIAAEHSVRFCYADALESLTQKLLHPLEIVTIKRYSLLETPNFNYDWTINSDLVDNGLNELSNTYYALRSELFHVSNVKENPRLDLSLHDGQIIKDPVIVCAYPRGFTIAPNAVTFSIDDEAVWTTPEMTPVPVIHKDVRGAYFLGGDGCRYDFSKLQSGRHELSVSCIVESGTQITNTVSFYT